MSLRQYPSLERLVARQLVLLPTKHRHWRAIILASLLAVTIVGAAWFYNRNEAHLVQASNPQLPQAVTDITYCAHNKLDIYLPRVRPAAQSPVVVFLHGGGWEINTKQSEPQQLARIDGLRDKGFAIASIDYRKIPDATFPAPLQDTLCAIRFLKANATRFNLDKQKFALYGFSAGGHLAALAATLPNEHHLQPLEYSSESSSVQAVVTLAGIFNLHEYLQPGTARRVATLLAGQDLAIAEPATYLSPQTPPFLLVHGLSDQHVFIEQDDYFARQLSGAGIHHEELRIANAGHGLEPIVNTIQPSEAVLRQKIQQFILTELLQ